MIQFAMNEQNTTTVQSFIFICISCNTFNKPSSDSCLFNLSLVYEVKQYDENIYPRELAIRKYIRDIF